MSKKISMRFLSLAVSLYILTLGSCDLFSPGLGDNVDITPPVLSISDPVSDPLQYRSENFTMTGTVSDDVGLSKVRISWPGGGTNASLSGDSWTAPVSLGEISSRGTILFSAVAYDKSGKASSPFNVNVVIDDAAPTVIVETPQSYNPGPTNSGYIQIEGEAWDRSDISAVTINVYDRDNPGTVVLSQEAEGTRSWSARITFDGSFTSGKTYYYEVIAQDMAGNSNAYVYHSSDFWAILPTGNLFPPSSAIGKWDQEGAVLPLDVGDGSLLFNETVKANMKIAQDGISGDMDFTYNSDKDIPSIDLSNLDPAQPVDRNSLGPNVPIYASATDDKEGIDTASVSLRIFQDNTTDPAKDDVDFTLTGSNFNSPGDGLYTSFEFDLSGEHTLEPGVYTGTITLADKKGTPSTLVFTFLVNKGAPVIVSMTPSSTYAGIEADGTLVTLVQIEDDNPGAQLILEAYETDGTPIAGVTSVISVAESPLVDGDETTYVSTWMGTVPSPVPDVLDLVVTVEDSSGLKNTRTQRMTVDRDNPTLAIVVPGAGDSISGNALTAGGTAADAGSEMYQVFVGLYEGTLSAAPGDISWTAAKGNTTWSLPIDLSGYAEGAFTLFAYPVDMAANTGDTSYVNFYFDLADPVLTLDQGLANQLVDSDYALTGNVSDSNGIVSFDIQRALNGGAFSSLAGYPETVFADDNSYDWTYAGTVDPAGGDDGIYDYTLTLTDVAGKTDEIKKRITVDTQGPEIVVSNLEDGDFVTSSTYKIMGLASDISGLLSVEYSLNGGAWTGITVAGTGNWELQVSGLSEGTGNTLQFRATDLIGHIRTLPVITFGLDLALPSLAIDNRDVLNGTWINGDLVLTGTAQDASGIALMQFSTNSGSTWTDIAGAVSVDSSVVNWSETVSAPSDGSEDGSHLVMVKAIDGYGKETTQSLLIKVDSTAPTFTVINLVNAQLLTASPYSVTGTWSDNGGSGTASADGALMEYSLNGSGTWNGFTTTLSAWYGNVAFPQGQDQTLSIRATDARGNVSSTALFTGIDVDTELPVLTETAVGTSDRQETDSDLVFSGIASDSNQLSSLVLSINGGAPVDLTSSVDGGTGAWSYTLSSATEGSFALIFTASDVAGRSVSVSRNVLIDRTAPLVVIDLPASGEYLSGSSYTVRGSVTEANAIASVMYSLDGSGSWFGVTGTQNWTQSLNLASLGTGDHTIAVRAIDEVGNSGTNSCAFRVDLSNPTVAETGFGSATGFTSGAFTLSGTVGDDLDVASLTVTQSFNGGASTGVTNDYGDTGNNDTIGSWSTETLPVGGLASGQYDYVMTVTDSAGKVSTLSRTVTVDVTAPNLDITSLLPMLSGNLINGVVTLSVNASDSNGLEGVKYFLRTGAGVPDYTDGDGVVLPAPYSVQIDSEGADFTDGTSYLLYVIARDRAGNESTSSLNFTVNGSSDTPSGEIISPVNGSQLGADHRIRGTFSDDDGVASDGAVLYLRRTGAGSWTAKSLGTASSAGQLVAWSMDVTDVVTAGGDGIYEMYLSITDNDTLKLGKPAVTYDTSSSLRTFGYDENAPVLSVLTLSPVGGAYGAGDTVTVSWTASDASGLGSQTILVDGSSTGLGSITNTGGDSYQVVYTVPSSGASSGYRTVSLVAEDTAGKTSTRTTSFLVDVDAPVVDSSFTLNPTFVGFTPNGAFTIRGSASDNLGLSGVEIELTDSLAGLDGSGWTAASLVSGTWSYAVADSAAYVPASGTLYFRVRALDNGGNSSAPTNFSQIIDQSADLATVSIISPVNASTYGTTVQISGTASDDDSLYDSDNNGIIDTDAVEIDYDTVPSSGSWSTVNPVITGSGNSASWNYTLSGLAGGSYQVRARARDDGGTWGNYSGTVEFTVNAGAPNMVVTTTVDSYRNNSVLGLNGTVADSDGVVDVRVRVNGGGWITVNAGSGSWGIANVSDTWSYSLNLGSDGFKTVEIQAEDASGFIANEQFSTRVDTTPPVGAFDSLFQDNPTGSYLATTALNGTIRITGTVEELNLEDADAVQIRIAQWTGATEGPEILAYTGVNGTYVWNYVWDTSALPDRQYILQLRITDKAGNITDTVTRVVTTNQSADDPQITQAFLNAPLPADAGTNVLQSLLKISGTLTDDDGFDSGAVNVYLDGSASPINASNTIGTTATWVYTWSSLSQGEHYLSLEATDRNGSVVTLGPTYFLVDTANPTLSLTVPAVSAKIKAGVLTVAGTALDGGGLDTDSLEITLDHSNNASPLEGLTYHPVVGGGTFSQSINIDGTSLDGSLTLFLTLTDRAGKQTSLSRSVTIDTTSPSLALNYPNPEAYINGLISISGTSDDLNGLADVTFQVLDPATKLPITSLSRSSSTMAAWEFAFNSFSYASSTYGEDINGDGTLWKIYFRLASTDNSGNVAEYLTGSPADWPYFYIDTDGDKPSISVTQPKNGDNIGGFVNMFGTATDDDGPVMQVEVRIDFNGDGDFADSRDINNDDGDDDPDTGIALGADQSFYGNTVRVGDSDEMWEDESAWYLVSVTNNSWSQNLNMSNELYASNTGGTGDIVLQVRTRDQFGLASEIIERTITLDETFPRIENIFPADQSYRNGQFAMTAEFGDNEQLNLSDLSLIGINVNKSGYTYLTAASPQLTANGANNGYDLSYDIDTNTYFPGSSGILYVDLYVRDQALYQNQKSYTFYVDNQNPSSSWSDRSGAPDGSNLSNGMITVNGVDRTYVEGNYDDAGVVNGISHMEMYFVDSSGDVRNIKSSGSYTPSASESINVQTYNLATNTWTDGSDPAAPLVTNDEAGDDYVIRIDRATEMSSQTLGTDLDGDGYEEFMGVVSGAPRWRAYFDSQYLPDGILELHYIVYDLAGNAVHRMREVFIANNGPSIERIQIGSDINASGSVANTGDVSEIIDYYYPAGSVDSSDAVKIKNNRIYLNVAGSDSNGTVDNIYVDVYDAAGVTRLGALATSAGSPLTTQLAVTAGASPWSSGYGTYNLKVIVRDNDLISRSHWVKVELVNPADVTPPVLTLNALSQSDQNGSIGHLELMGDYGSGWSALSTAYGDDDPKASGIIRLTGRVTDESRIEGISGAAEGLPVTTLAHWVSGQLVSNTADFIINSQSLTQSGHQVDFTYNWDTSNITGTAGLDRVVSFTAQDGGGNSSNTGSQQVDVVPYITGISRDSGTYNTYRSRQGRFILRQGEEVTFTGFNIYNSTSDSVTLSNTSGGTTSFALPSAGSTSDGFTLSSLDGTVATGDVVLTVNGLESINNLNSNELTYNRETTASAAYDNSWLWTDDRAIHVWLSDNNQAGNNRGYFTGSQDPEYPAMAINGSGILYGSWSNYASSNILYGPNNGNPSTIFHGYDPSEHTDIALGNRVTVAFNANLYGNNGWDVTGAGGTYIWDNQASRNYTGTAYNGVYVAEALYHDQKLMQFINQRVVVSGNNIHTSYYDTDTKALKYFYRLSNNDAYYSQAWINVDGGSDTHDGTRIVDNGGPSRAAAAGEFSAVDVAPGTGYPVIAYYDITNKTVKLARSTAVNPGAAQWSLQTVMAGDDENFTYSGKYITMKIDSQGYVHLAFYRNSTGDLIYMKSTNNPTDGTGAYTFGDSVIIDSIGSVGVWADLTLENDEPVISYLDSSLVNTFDGIKMAYYDSTLETTANEFTGESETEPDTQDGWETMNAALNYEVESVRTSVETDTGSNSWSQAVGYSSNDYFRIGYYVK